MKKYGRTDDNQREIVLALRKAGCQVLSLAALGSGVPDLLVCRNGVQFHLLEIKDGRKSASQRKLTTDQVKFHKAWPVTVVTSVDEALAAVGAIKGGKL